MELNRDKLLKIAMQVRPALSSQPYIPALSHIRFSGGDATAYNDVSAITVEAGCDLEVCVPGELLIRALQSLNAEKVLVKQGQGSLVLSAGRAKLKLPANTQVDTSRTITVEFDANARGPWLFRPAQASATISW